MRKILLLHCSLFIGLSLFATRPLMEFSGITIEGNYSSFCETLIKSGYRQIGDNTFIDANNPNLSVKVSSSDNHNLDLVIVNHPSGNSWEELFNTYMHLKQRFKENYGNPFQENEKALSSSNKLESIIKNSGSCETIYQAENGLICLAILDSEDGVNNAHVCEFYVTSNAGNSFLNNTSHLKFMNIPINGSLDNMITQLKERGLNFITKYDSNNEALLTGSFAGFKNCNFYVRSLGNGSLVYSVGVCLPNEKNWKDLSSNYYYHQKSLINKYGEPSTCIERFNTHDDVSDDLFKWVLTISDKCEYYTLFKTDDGIIVLHISHIENDGENKCYVSLYYIDSINYFLKENINQLDL